MCNTLYYLTCFLVEGKYCYWASQKYCSPLSTQFPSSGKINGNTHSDVNKVKSWNILFGKSILVFESILKGCHDKVHVNCSFGKVFVPHKDTWTQENCFLHSTGIVCFTQTHLNIHVLTLFTYFPIFLSHTLNSRDLKYQNINQLQFLIILYYHLSMHSWQTCWDSFW